MADNANSLEAGTKIKPVPKKDPEIGVDTTDNLSSLLLDGVATSQIDLSSIDSFSNVAQTRESVFNLIDTMTEDDRVSAVLETYAEDTVETNEAGNSVWCESSNDDINKYVTNLLDSLNVNKNVYEWTYSLIKYGDVYLRLYRESDYGNDLLFGDNDLKKQSKQMNESIEDKLKNIGEEKEQPAQTLNEEAQLIMHEPNDHYVNYVEMVSNPSEMFELTKFGKTMGYIQAPTRVQKVFNTNTAINDYMAYKMKKSDVLVYSATDFVHASLKSNNQSRCPEEVSIFLNDTDDESANALKSTYKVKKGQSMLYNLFRVWRELTLLENSILLSRLTKSSVLRIINVEVGDMPKEKVRDLVTRLKSTIEQKTSLSVGDRAQEYTNPGPVENTLYTTSHQGTGVITATNVGGDYDPKQLTDLDYFLDKFYGALRVPKQFFNQTSDSTGFNGGSSLAIISSRYGKAVKRIQATVCQLVTDLVNLYLVDRKLFNYINKFTIKMQVPVTQEELDRRENQRNITGVINDIMGQINNVVTDDETKLEITKAMLTPVLNTEVITLLQNQIDINKKAKDAGEAPAETSEKPKHNSEPSEPPSSEEPEKGPSSLDNKVGFGGNTEEPKEETSTEETSTENGTEEETVAPVETQTTENGAESYLPSPNELGVSMVNNK